MNIDFSAFLPLILSFLTLSFLEIVLGIDNLIFLSIISNRLPREKQKKARRFGLLLALGARLVLLSSVIWISKLHKPLFTILTWSFSGRDLFLFFGGLFLIYKSVEEIHAD